MAKSGRSGLKKNLFAVCAVVAYALIGSASGAWADEEGAELAWKYHCVTCHGDTGVELRSLSEHRRPKRGLLGKPPELFSRRPRAGQSNECSGSSSER